MERPSGATIALIVRGASRAESSSRISSLFSRAGAHYRRLSSTPSIGFLTDRFFPSRYLDHQSESPSLSRSCRINQFPIADIAAASDAGRMSEDNLIWRSQWYLSQCDHDWEHSYGVKIENLDNPGWSLKIDLTDTEMQGHAFERVEYGEPSGDLEEWQRTGSWWVAHVEGDAFEVACGPLDLSAAVGVFRRWVEASA